MRTTYKNRTPRRKSSRINLMIDAAVKEGLREQARQADMSLSALINSWLKALLVGTSPSVKYFSSTGELIREWNLANGGKILYASTGRERVVMPDGATIQVGGLDYGIDWQSIAARLGNLSKDPEVEEEQINEAASHAFPTPRFGRLLEEFRQIEGLDEKQGGKPDSVDDDGSGR